MKYLIILFLFLSFGCHRQASDNIYLQESEIILAPPIVTADNIFFDTCTYISVSNDQNIIIRYTDDGSNPNTTSKVADSEINVCENSVLKFRAFREGIKPSKIVSTSTFKNRNLSWAKISGPEANENYDAGIDALTDQIKGGFNFKAKAWNGFQDSIISFSFNLAELKMIKGITLSTLVDQKSWIFSPKNISVTYSVPDGSVRTKYINIADWDLISDKFMNFIEIDILPTLITGLTMHINMGPIPDWHPGKGNFPWFFIDEILIF